MVRDTKNDNDVDGLRIASTVMLLHRAIDQAFRQASPSDDLSLAELGVLGRVDLGQDLPSTLARLLKLDPGRVTRIADRLVSLGYMARDVDPVDRRRWRLHLTPEGNRRLEAGKAALSAVMTTALEDLSATERAALTEGLDGVRRILDASRDVPRKNRNLSHDDAPLTANPT